MTVEDLISVWGNKAGAARATGNARCTLTTWEKSGGIPYDTQCRLYFDFAELKDYPPNRDDVNKRPLAKAS